MKTTKNEMENDYGELLENHRESIEKIMKQNEGITPDQFRGLIENTFKLEDMISSSDIDGSKISEELWSEVLAIDEMIEQLIDIDELVELAMRDHFFIDESRMDDQEIEELNRKRVLASELTNYWGNQTICPYEPNPWDEAEPRPVMGPSGDSIKSARKISRPGLIPKRAPWEVDGDRSDIT